MADNKIRLQKFLSEAGVASRRKAEEMIRSGLIKVNGHVAQIGDSVDPKKDVITVKGKGYEYAEKDPSVFHGISKFDVDTGEAIISSKSSISGASSKSTISCRRSPA